MITSFRREGEIYEEDKDLNKQRNIKNKTVKIKQSCKYAITDVSTLSSYPQKGQQSDIIGILYPRYWYSVLHKIMVPNRKIILRPLTIMSASINL